MAARSFRPERGQYVVLAEAEPVPTNLTEPLEESEWNKALPVGSTLLAWIVETSGYDHQFTYVAENQYRRYTWGHFRRATKAKEAAHRLAGG